MKKLTLLSLLCAIFSFGAMAQTFSGGGAGTEADPYVILISDDLLAMNDVTYDPAAYTYFRMDADVDMEGVEWTAFNVASPYEKAVYFNGNGHVIKNLDTGGYNYSGLFGILRGVCKNLGVIDARVGNASSKYNGSNNCNTAGIIAGFLANNNYNVEIGRGIIENCYTTGVVAAAEVVGGIVGNLGRPASGSPISYIRNSYSKATVIGTKGAGNLRVGGIVGVVAAPAGVTPHPVEVEYCFSTGTVIGGSSSNNNGPGGLVGYSDLPMNGLVSLNTSVNRPDLSYDQYGRISAVVTNNTYTDYECWALESVNVTKNGVQKTTFNQTPPVTNYNSFDGISKTAEFLADMGNWADLGYDTDIWEMGDKGHPIFKWQSFEPDDYVIPGDVLSYPIPLYTAEDLNNIRNNMDAHYVLMNDIDISEDYPSWVPLGKTAEGTDTYTWFYGHFNGNGHVISGVNINYTGFYVGFFAGLGGTITNLGIKGNVVNNNGATTGLLVGYLGQTNYASIIENCFAEGTVTSTATTGNDSHSGLLVGNQTKAHCVIRNSYAKGAVTANKNFVGGIAGRQNQQHAFITNCYSEVDVRTEGDYVGGIVGRIYGSNANNLYATGTIQGKSYVGGIAGDRYNTAASSGLVAANDSVLASLSYLGRVVGNIGTGASVSNTYALESTVVELDGVAQSITSSSTGKDGESKTLAQLQNIDLYTGMGWDFTDLWAMPHTTCAAGFPIFKRELKDCIGTSEPNTKSYNYQIASNEAKLSILGLKWNSRIRIFDAVGMLVKEAYATGGLQLDLPGKGVYIVEIQHENTRDVVKTLSR